MRPEEFVTKVALAVTPIFKFRYNTLDMNIIKTMPEDLKLLLFKHQEQPNLKMLVELHRKIVELTQNNTYLEKGAVVPKNKENLDWEHLQKELEVIIEKYNAMEPKKAVNEVKTEKRSTASLLAIPGALDVNSLKTELASTTRAINKSAAEVKELATPKPEFNPGSH